MKDKILLETILNRLACHYSVSENKEFDTGYNQAVKDLCKVFIDEVKKEHNNQWYTKGTLSFLSKSF